MRHLIIFLVALVVALPAQAQTTAPVYRGTGGQMLEAQGVFCVTSANTVCPAGSPTDPTTSDTVVHGGATDYGAPIGTTAAPLIPSSATRRGYAIQNQSSTATCYISATGTATADYHSLQIPAGGYYETPTSYVGTTAVSIICSAAATPIFARAW